MVIASPPIGVAVAQAFGIHTERLMQFDLHFRVNDIVKATCVYSVVDPKGDLVRITKQFEIEARPANPPADANANLESLSPEERVRIKIEQIAATKRKQLADDIATIRAADVLRELNLQFDPIRANLRYLGLLP